MMSINSSQSIREKLRGETQSQATILPCPAQHLHLLAILITEEKTKDIKAHVVCVVSTLTCINYLFITLYYIT